MARGHERLSLEIAGVRDTGITVGDGSYATVKELDYHGLKCVGKKIHGILYDSARPQEKAHMLERFVIECELLSRLHHPSIVQFLGIYFESGSQMPVMVMEFLHTTLSNLIDDYGILPGEISYDVFRDVALGLRYLHEQSPCIVHRDLSANNVLMSKEMKAKISDLGVAKILNLRPSQMTQTQTPGTPAYMPPETMVARPKYTSKVDIFSYGVMMVHVLSGQWPIPGSVFRADPANPSTMIPLSEIERRVENFQTIRPDHPLMELIRLCLSNFPDPRPEAVEILRQVDAVIAELPPTFGDKVEMILQLQSQNRNGEVADLRRENDSLRRELDSKTTEIEGDSRATAEKTRENETLRRELDAQRRETVTKKRESEAQQWEIEQQRSEVKSVRRENQLLREQLEKQRIPFPKPATTEPPPPIHLARIQWKRVADLPVRLHCAQSALVKGRVYIGGGNTDSDSALDIFLMFGYDLEKDCWNTVSRCPVSFFAMGEFRGELITVGGYGGEGITGNVHRFNELSQQWELHLQPLPTARYGLSIITTESAIVACGGGPEMKKYCATVEVYMSMSGQWHVADPLPFPNFMMTSAKIGDTGYLVGGVDNNTHTTAVPHISIPSLIDKATSVSACVQQLPKSSKDSLWKTLTPTPLFQSSAVSLGGHLLAVAGVDDQHGKCQVSPAVHVFLPSTNTWERIPSGDLPEPMYCTCSVQLLDNQLMVCGGISSANKITSCVYMGNVTKK